MEKIAVNVEWIIRMAIEFMPDIARALECENCPEGIPKIVFLFL